MLEYLPKTMSILTHTVIFLYILVTGLQLIIAKKFYVSRFTIAVY